MMLGEVVSARAGGIQKDRNPSLTPGTLLPWVCTMSKPRDSTFKHPSR